MRPLRPRTAPAARRGAVLLLSVLLVFLVLMVVAVINAGTATDARVARNDVALTRMDLAVEATLRQVFEQLVEDAEADQSAGDAGAAAGGAGGMAALGGLGGLTGAGGGEGEGGGPPDGPVDGRNDPWSLEQSASVGDVQLVTFVQAENSKLNVLWMLTPDEAEAVKAFDRVTRVLDLFREGTDYDLDGSEAADLADAMREHLTRRDGSLDARPELVTDDEDDRDQGLPLTMREFLPVFQKVDPGHTSLFLDFVDEDGERVHSITSFLTVHSALWTRQEFSQGGEGGGGQGGGGDGGGGGGGAGGGGGQGGSTPNAGGSGDTPAGLGQGSSQGQGGGQGPQAAGAEGAQVPGAGGGGSDGLPGAINPNLAPRAVLFALAEDRAVPSDFWDAIVEYRNEPVEDDETEQEAEETALYDRFGDEIEETQQFTDTEQFEELDGWEPIEPVDRSDIERLFTFTSDVFTIYVVARFDSTGQGLGGLSRDEQLRLEASGTNLVRAIACTVWRRQGEDGFELVPITRWEELEYVPLPVYDDAEVGR